MVPIRVGCTTHRLLSNLPEKVYASGNRDGIGSHKVLQKISSERNLQGRPFVDTIQSLAHLRARFVKEDQEMYPEHVKESGLHRFGYIHNRCLSTQPLSRCGRKPTCAYSSIWLVTALSFSTRQAKLPPRFLTPYNKHRALPGNIGPRSFLYGPSEDVFSYSFI